MTHLHHFLRVFVEVSHACGSMFAAACCLVVFCGDEVPLSTKVPGRNPLGNWASAKSHSRKLSQHKKCRGC
jgi:hypothetical protein